MKKTRAVLVLLLFASTLSAQIQKHKFSGVLSPESMEPIQLKLEFEVDEFNQLKGTSITDPDGPNRTVSLIQGSYNGFELSFRELNNVETKADEQHTNFCFITASGLTISQGRGKVQVSGKFDGKLPSGEHCAKGKISLFEENLKTKKQEPNRSDLGNIDTKENSKPEKSKENNPKRKLIKPAHEVLNYGDREEVRWTSSSCSLYLSDTFKNDGDSINVIFNGREILNKVCLETTKLKINLQLISGTNSIIIKAINEGSISPNTVQLLFVGENDVLSIKTSLMKAESAEIHLKTKSVMQQD